MQGWIKFKREWLENPVITKDNDHLVVWLILVSRAAFEQCQAIFEGKVRDLKLGELVIKKAELAKEMNIDRYKLIRILKAFENAHLIAQQTDCHKTLISLASWEILQDKNAQLNAQQVHSYCTAEQDRENEKEKRSKREKEKEKEIIKNVRIKEVCVRGNTHEKICLGPYENVFVRKSWYDEFCEQYSFADKIVYRLSVYKEAHEITNENDEPYLERFALEDEKELTTIKRQPTYGDADEAFERAIARSYAEDSEDDYW